MNSRGRLTGNREGQYTHILIWECKSQQKILPGENQMVKKYLEDHKNKWSFEQQNYTSETQTFQYVKIANTEMV